MKRIASIIAIIIVQHAGAQWNVATKVVLDGGTPVARQITGLALPQSAAQGSSAAADRVNATTYAVASGSNALTLALTPTLSIYAPGMRIMFTPTEVNTGDATLDIDGVGVVPLRKYVNAPLDSADLRPGVPLQVIFDGAAFQVVNQLHPACPAGYMPLGREACVEIAAHDSLNWYSANVYCVSHGARLCGFAEWIQACLQTNSILPSVSNYEWVDNAANSNNTAKTMGIIENTTTPDCRSGGHKLPIEHSRFRCCYDR